MRGGATTDVEGFSFFFAECIQEEGMARWSPSARGTGGGVTMAGSRRRGR